MLKTDVFTPMPSARQTIARRVKPGDFRDRRSE
jgi:hypothetical protein